MRQTRRALALTALSCMLLVGCSDDGVRLSLYDGYSTKGVARQEVAASTFRVTREPKLNTPRHDGWGLVELVIPDEAVGGLPLELTVAVTCSHHGLDGRKKAEVYGTLRVVEARHDGLFAEYTYACDDKTVTGKGLFEVIGGPRDGVWAYAPEPPPSTVTKLVNTARHVIVDVFY